MKHDLMICLPLLNGPSEAVISRVFVSPGDVKKQKAHLIEVTIPRTFKILGTKKKIIHTKMACVINEVFVKEGDIC